MPDTAVRVGAISNYKKGEDKATFEVVPPGKDKGYKASAWLTIGKGWDEATRKFTSREPNPLIEVLDNLRAADLEGPWRVEGTERFVDGKEFQYRAFNATLISKANDGDTDVFTINQDGTPYGETSNGAGPTQTSNNGSAPVSVDLGGLKWYLAWLIATVAKAGDFSPTDDELLAQANDLFAHFSEPPRATPEQQQNGWAAPVPM